MLVTLPIPILIGLLAQAEPAPAEPTAQPAEAATSGNAAEAAPAEAPAPTPALPAASKPEPGPGTAGGEALPVLLGFRAGADFQLSGDVTPRVGYSFSPFGQYDYARIAEGLQLGVRAEFVFDRFQQLLQSGQDRALSFFDFVLLATGTVELGLVRPWAGVGAGLGLAHFSSDQASDQPGNSSTTRPLIVGAFGLDVAVRRGMLVGLHGEYRGMLDKPDFLLDSGKSLKPFSDRLSAQVAVLYHF